MKKSTVFTLVMTLLVLLNLQACSRKSTPQNQQSGSMEMDGGSTNVGGGGIGAEAEWKAVAQELAENIRLLKHSSLDEATFHLIKSRFAEVVKKAKLEFKDYPLILGEELADSDNPSKRKFPSDFTCPQVSPEDDNTPRTQERDAINFPQALKIKVSRPRFACYPSRGSQISRLVLHEYLGLLGFSEKQGEQTQYEITQKLLADFKEIPKFEDGLEQVTIENCAQLQEIGQDRVPFGDATGGLPQFPYAFKPKKIWVLQKDVDCVESRAWNDGKGFTPRYLTGHFNGNGFTIKNLFSSGHNEGGLFKANCTQCVIANLAIEKATVRGQSLLINQNFGTIANSSVQGRLFLTTGLGGGLMVINRFGSVKSCSTEVEVISESGLPLRDIGGLAYQNHQGTIVKSSAVIKSKSLGGRAGGLIAHNFFGEIHQCSARTEAVFAITDSIAFTSVGGLVGDNEGAITQSEATGVIQLRSRAEIKRDSVFVGDVVGRTTDSPTDSHGLMNALWERELQQNPSANPKQFFAKVKEDFVQPRVDSSRSDLQFCWTEDSATQPEMPLSPCASPIKSFGHDR